MTGLLGESGGIVTESSHGLLHENANVQHMQKPEHQTIDPAAAPEKKHNLGAKLLISLGVGGFISGKVALLGLVADVNNLFPKGTALGSKIKQTFSKEILPLIGKSVEHEMRVNGRSEIMATLAATKWFNAIFVASSVVLGVIGWQRADRISDSNDIFKHPWKSTKIILGLQEPDPAPAAQQQVQGKHTAAIKAERAAQAEVYVQR